MFYSSFVLFIVICCPFIVLASHHSLLLMKCDNSEFCSPIQFRMFFLCNSIEWTEMSTIFLLTVLFETQAEGNLMFSYPLKVLRHFAVGPSVDTVFQEFSSNLFLIFETRRLNKVPCVPIEVQISD